MGADHPQPLQRSDMARELDALQREINTIADVRATIEALEEWRDVRRRRNLDVRVMNRSLGHLRRLERVLCEAADMLAFGVKPRTMSADERRRYVLGMAYGATPAAAARLATEERPMGLATASRALSHTRRLLRRENLDHERRKRLSSVEAHLAQRVDELTAERDAKLLLEEI